MLDVFSFVDGIECLYEVEVDQVHRVSFVQQTDYTFVLHVLPVGQAGSMRKESMLTRFKGSRLCEKQKQGPFEQCSNIWHKYFTQYFT